MRIEIDLSTVPPTTVLHEPDEFTSFKVVVRSASDAHVTPDVLRGLAGERAEDPEWAAQLDGMLAYAAKQGWIREGDGAIQAHVEAAD